jgi:putative transposase
MARIKAKERSPEEKLGIVLEFLRGTPASELCRKHGMSEGTLNKWRDRMLAAGTAALSGKRILENPLEAENQQLKEALADLTLRVQVLKKIQR